MINWKIFAILVLVVVFLAGIVWMRLSDVSTTRDGKAKPDFDQYGGWKKIKGQATGYFHAEEINGRWWLVTPEGNAFIAAGVNSINYGANQAKLAKEFEAWNFNFVSQDQRFFSSDFVIDAFASDILQGHLWPPDVAPGIRIQLEIPGAELPPNAIPTLKASAFPDVFDDRFRTLVEAEFKEKAKKYKNESKLLGYYLGGEYTWEPYRDFGLLDLFLNQGAGRAGKRAAVDFIKNRYGGDITEFNRIWGTQMSSFNELLEKEKVFKAPKMKSDKNEKKDKDRSEFLRLVAEKYYRTNSEVVRKYDPNHMILGSRFAGYIAPPEVMETIGKYTDIVSYDIYDDIRKDLLDRDYKVHKKPIMINEFGFAAKDSGLPNDTGVGAMKLVETQRDRALAYEKYVSSLLSLPYAVGFVWYKYDDDPARPTGYENSNCGLVNGKEEPYKDFVLGVKDVNSRIYQIAEKGGKQ